MPTKPSGRTRKRRNRPPAPRPPTTATVSRRKTIRLPHGTWTIETTTPLGQGGFSTVYPGKRADGLEVAVKQLDPPGNWPVERELQVTEGLIGRACAHVIPILDAGRDGGSVFIVMARATDNLASAIQARRTFTEPGAIDVLLQIVAGLGEIGDIVHRDLKPANVLWHDGAWKIADLGLVRFADAATSTNTVKMAFTPPYAAPEQWRGDHATHATDVYALACIGYALMTGAPPFLGGDLQAQHLGKAPPPLAASPPLRQLLSRCLAKSPDSRPTLSDLRVELERAANPVPAKPLRGLQEVAEMIATAQAKEEAARERLRREAEERARAGQAGLQVARDLFREFFERLRSAAPNAVLSPDGREIRLGRASLSYREAFPVIQPEAFPRSRFGAIAGLFVQLRQEGARYPGRSSNLWLAKLDAGSFEWWEASYMTSPLIPSRRPDEPFGLASSAELEVADRAAGPAMDTHQYAMKVTRVEGDGREAFMGRWADRFAAAATGMLDRPRSLPE